MSLSPQSQTNATGTPAARPVILASGSPRRRELLGSLGVPFTVIKPEVDEEAFDLSHLPPGEVVKFLSRVKAQEVFKHRPQSIVIGVDTIVVLNGEVFGKPKNEDHALAMLKALQGTTHEVYSGITLFNPDDSGATPPLLSDFRRTRVTMRPLSEADIRAYIATGEPMDKAGAYAIQEVGSTLVDGIEGCYFNVVGMSLVLLDAMFREIGQPLVLKG